MSQQLVQVYRASHSPDGAGGRARTWAELQSKLVDVKLGNTRDGMTGESQVERQEATITTHRWTPIEVDDRLVIGGVSGVEFVVIGVDPPGPSITRKVYARRVEHEEIDRGST